MSAQAGLTATSPRARSRPRRIEGTTMFKKILVPVDLADTDAQQRQSAEEALTIIARESGLKAGQISATVRQGGIYHEVLEEAKSIHADLIVVSSHLPATKSYFLGSNAGHVVRFAKCSVLVVRHTQ